MTTAKRLAYAVTLLGVLVAIIAAATFQPRPSDRHSMPSSSHDHAAGHGLRTRTDQRYTALADELDERIRAGRLGTGGQILDPTDLAGLTHRTPTAIRHALQQLALTGTVEHLERQWCIPDDHDTIRAARRAHHLLDAMIAAGGYPSAGSLPPADQLAETLLTPPDAIALALHTLTTTQARQLSRPVAPEGRSSAPSRTGSRAVPLGAATAWDPHALRHLRDRAREQWHLSHCPSHHTITHTEKLQHNILHRLSLAADRLAATSSARCTAVRATVDRAAAARETSVISLGERHWRSAVLAGILAELADALSPTSVRP
ncbi:hypothetical protein AB0387_20515 [Streptomyces sp. NPDC089173]|uniref:hypothetical protein n=1 Tax=Streptomyces sp. NPDC089173 TaxID=3154965 RepID=UPI00344B4C6A